MAATRRGSAFKFQVLALLAVLGVATGRQITVYDDHHGDGPRSTHDYSDFVGDDSPISDSEDDAKASSGFAAPLDFSSFFSSGFGAAGASGDAGGSFLPQGSELKPFTLPLGAAGSPFADHLQGSASSKNGTGFTSPAVKFQSFFDSGGAESGFRAQDFLDGAKNPAADGETSANAPADFFLSSGFGLDDHDDHDGGADRFGYSAPTSQGERASEYRSLVKPTGPNKSDKYATPSGKSSYPAVRGQQQQQQQQQQRPHTSGAQKHHPGSYAKTPSFASYQARPASSYKAQEPSRPSSYGSSYNPTKANYKTSQKPGYDYESKSGYPKKATEFYPTKVGTKYTQAATNHEAASYSSPSYDPSSYADERASYEAEHFLPTASSPYSPSEYGKESYQAAPLVENEGLVEEVKITVSADNKNCRKIEKKLAKDNTMTCYVCEDPNTGGNIEKCSYESDPSAKSQSYFHGHAKTFSSDQGKKPTSYRYRRGLADFGFAPFDSVHTYSQPRVRIARQQKPSDSSNYRTNYDEYIAKFSEPSESQYRYQPERYTQEASYDDAEYKPQPQEAANNKDCKTVVKGTMTCSVCQNPKTGGSSEQCSYATNPDENNYFVARQSSFNTKNKPYRKESSSARSTAPVKSQDFVEGGSDRSGQPSSKVPYETSTESAYIVTSKSRHQGPGEYGPQRRSDEGKEESTAEEGKAAGGKAAESNVEKNYDDYFKELFPEVVAARNAESRQASDKYSSPRSSYDAEARSHGDGDGDAYKGASSEEYKVDGSVEEFDDTHRKNNGPKSLSYRPSAVEDFGTADKNSGGKSFGASPAFGDAPKKRASPPRPSPNYNNKPVADFDEYNQEYVQQSPQHGRDRARNGPGTHENLRSNAQSDNEGYAYAASTLPDYFADTEPKRDLEKVLGEFSQKDRSACKKVIRDKMTCYQCVDKHGVQHEECMFVAASEPKSQHLAYHEVKEFRIQPGNDTTVTDSTKPLEPRLRAIVVPDDSTGSQTLDVSQTAAAATKPSPVGKTSRRLRSQIVKPDAATTTQRPANKRKTFFKKVTTTTTTTVKPNGNVKKVVRVHRRPIKAAEEAVAAASDGAEVRVRRKKPRRRDDEDSEPREQDSGPRDRDSGRQDKSAGDGDDEVGTRTEFFVHPDDLYPPRTERKYDPVLKVSLPAFMVERSEHEEIFDEVLAAGI